MKFSFIKWLIITFILKGALAIYLAFLLRCGSPETALSHFSFRSGDTFSYTEAMENYITQNNYFFYNGNENVYAGRLPHYSIPYFLLRQFTNKSTAYNLLSIFQLLIESIAILYLILLTMHISKSRIASLLVWLMCIISCNWTILSLFASPESLSCSFLIIFIYFFNKYITSNKIKHLLLAGTFLALLITLKAYFIPVLGLVIFYIFLNTNNQRLTLKDLKFSVRKYFLFILPLILLLTPWIWRNFTLYHKVIPLQINSTAGYNYTDSELAFRRFVGAWGGDVIHWEKTSAGCYFIPAPGISCNFELPDYAVSKGYNKRSIEKVRNDFISLQKNYTISLDKKVSTEFDRLTELYRTNSPFRYYIISPLKLIVRFLNHSGSYYLPIHESNQCFSNYQLTLKIFQSIFYWGSITIGLIGLLLISFHTKNFTYIIIPLYIIILFPFILRVPEWRYLRTIEPLCYIGMVYFINAASIKLKHRQYF